MSQIKHASIMVGVSSLGLIPCHLGMRAESPDGEPVFARTMLQVRINSRLSYSGERGLNRS